MHRYVYKKESIQIPNNPSNKLKLFGGYPVIQVFILTVPRMTEREIKFCNKETPA